MITCPSCQASYEEIATRFCGRCGSDMRLSPDAGDGQPDQMLGRVIDSRYRILDKLGHGGTGSVYRVEHLAMGKIAAMKLLHPSLSHEVEVGRRFRREAEAVSRLSHPNTVQVFDFGTSGGLMYLVMELVRGEDLGTVLRRDGPMPFARICSIMVQVCDALSEAHEIGIVHRDIKPENLIVSRTRDGRELVKVLDFGLAKLRDSEELNQVTAHGSLVGTPFYMSPEQIRAEELDARSDIYSLGALLYRALTGEHPFTAATPVAVLTQHLTEPLEPPSLRRPDLAVHPEVEAVVMKAMAKRKEDRYGSAEDLKQALEWALRQSAADLRAVEGETGERRASDRRLDPTGSSPLGADALKREDIDAYERALRRRRRAGLLALPLVAVLGLVAFTVGSRIHTPQPVDVEKEPNNTPAEANFIAAQRTVRGHIGKRLSLEESDRDFFAFRITGGVQVLRVELTGIPTMDLKLEVYSPLGDRIAQTDAGGIGDGEIIPNLRLEPGNYLIQVREVWEAGKPATEDSTNWYTLTASWHALTPNEESEPDDSPAQAIPLKLDSPMRGYLGRAGDVDYFYPRGDGGGTLSGFLSGIEGVDTRIVVLPPGAGNGPPGPLPAGAQVFDAGGPGASERFDGVKWPAGSAGPVLVVERKEPAAADGKRAALVGLDIPYSLTVRLTR